MEQVRLLAVCDSEKDYSLQLSAYAQVCGNYPFHIQPFTSVRMLQDYMKRKEVDAVLLEESLYDPEQWKHYRGILFLLGNGVGKENGPPRIFKYQSAGDLLTEIMAEYTGRMPRAEKPVVKKRGMEVYGIYSPVGRCGKSSFALALALELSRTDPVLYLNLETWPALEGLCTLTGEWSLSDFLYYLRDREEGLLAQLQLMLVRLGTLELLRPAASPEDLAVVSAADWRHLLEQLRISSSYTAVVLDIGDSVQPVEELLALCSFVYIPVEEDPVSAAKLRRFLEFLEKACGSEFSKDFSYLHLPRCPAETETEFYTEKLLWGSMGNFVRDLLERKGDINGTETAKKAESYAGRKRSLYRRRSTPAD